MGFLTGKSTQKSQSSSENKAYPYIKDAYGGAVNQGTGAMSQVAALLGIGGDKGAANAAFNNYKQSTGYQNVIDSGTDAIAGNAAARGLLRSGGTGKAFTGFAHDTAKNYYQQYLQQLLGLSGQGLQAGGLISNAGQTSQSTQEGKSKPGLAAGLGTIAAGIPSDRRLKTDVVAVGTADNGLTVYEYRYIWDEPDSPVRRGYMADEVAEVAPHALGGKTAGGYDTVVYSRLPDVRNV